MARTKQTGRNSTGGNRRGAMRVRSVVEVWHPLLIAAADHGGRERLFAGLAAKEELVGRLRYTVSREWQHRHPDTTGAYESAAAEGAVSPFPLASSFGLLPYAAFRGHEDVVMGLCAVGFDVEATAQVLTVNFCEKWAMEALGLRLGRYRMVAASFRHTPFGRRDSVRADALQIASYKRDAAIVRLLRQVPGVPQQHPFLLDVIKPESGSLIASQKGAWSTAFHPFCPPAFKAAAAELLRISHKHGGAVGPSGRLRWAFTPGTLAELLLPLLADDMSAWLDTLTESEWLTQTRRQAAAAAAAAAAAEGDEDVIVISSSDEDEEGDEESEEEESEEESDDEDGSDDE